MTIDGNHSKKAMSGARFVPAKLPPGRCAGLRKRAGPSLPTLTFWPRTSALAQTPSSAGGLPVHRRLLCLPSTARPWTASRLRPSHGGQEAAVAGPLRALFFFFFNFILFLNFT